MNRRDQLLIRIKDISIIILLLGVIWRVAARASSWDFASARVENISARVDVVDHRLTSLEQKVLDGLEEQRRLQMLVLKKLDR